MIVALLPQIEDGGSAESRYAESGDFFLDTLGELGTESSSLNSDEAESFGCTA